MHLLLWCVLIGGSSHPLHARTHFILFFLARISSGLLKQSKHIHRGKKRTACSSAAAAASRSLFLRMTSALCSATAVASILVA